MHSLFHTMCPVLDKIRIIAIATSHPGNLGGIARAMKNMGLTRLYLVGPHHFPHPDAYARAAGALDILDSAVVVHDLTEALDTCSLVMGTSARTRHIPLPILTPREAAAQCVASAPSGGDIAILFGREQSGLTNEELQLCHYQIHIPCDPDFSSLNLAAAVQLLCYELRLSAQSLADTPPDTALPTELATAEEMAKFYTHLEETLIQIHFLNPTHPKHLITRLQRLYNRARPDKTELNLLRGILTAVQKQGNK